MQRNAKKCWEMQRNVVRQTGIILAKIRALDGRNYGRNSNFIFNFNFLKKSKLAKSWWAPTILWNKWFFFRENNHCTFCAIHRACTWFNCPKQHNNALSVHKITKRQAIFHERPSLHRRARLQTGDLGTRNRVQVSLLVVRSHNELWVI